MKRKTASNRQKMLAAAKALLHLVPPRTRVLLPRGYRSVDPVAMPKTDFSDPWFLEQVSLGRWIDAKPDNARKEMRIAFETLGKYLAPNCARYLFAKEATPEQVSKVFDMLYHSYARGFYLALLRYSDDLKHVPEAAAIRAALARGRKLGADTVRKKAVPKKMAVRKRFRELRKSGFTKTAARQLIEQETDISFRQIERDTAGLS